MANKTYRYKRLATSYGKLKIKAWHRPILLIRKVGDLTCEGCFFDKSVSNKTPSLTLCSVMEADRQGLPSCNPNGPQKRQYIFVKKHNKR